MIFDNQKNCVDHKKNIHHKITKKVIFCDDVKNH